MAESGASTVRFNVGGKQYEVSRSLIEQHESTVLARMISETWQQDPNATVFIDRDGEHFRHVLQFLRYGSVSLPMTVSKTALLQDMDFYGIHVPDGSIDGSIDTFNAVKHVAMLKQNYEKLRKCIPLAHNCFEKYMRTRDLTVEFRPNMADKSEQEAYEFAIDVKKACHQNVFNECLAKYGLRCLEWTTNSSSRSNFYGYRVKLGANSPSV